MAHQRINWQALPSQATPANTDNMNHMDKGIYDNSVAISNIVESGTNQYGNWIKYSDGTMICTRIIAMTINCTLPWGSLYVGSNTEVWNFSQTFIEPPIINIKCIMTGSGSFFEGEYSGLVVSNNYFRNIAIMRPSVYNDVKLSVHVIAIGKWK